MDVFDSLLNFFLPSYCPGCGKEMAEGDAWCEACLLQNISVQRHALPSALGDVLENAWSLALYRGGLKQLIWDLKFRKKKERLLAIDKFLEQVPAKSLPLPENIIAAAVPLHPDREQERGFNQVELIFAAWLKRGGIPLMRPLVRQRNTNHQYGLSLKERSKNLKGAMALSPGAQVCGKSFLLLDDILTTGATLSACAKVLKEGGAGKIFALTLAGDP